MRARITGVAAVGAEIFRNALSKTGLSWEDSAVVRVHRVTLPLRLATALEQGRWGPGDRVGPAGGVSLGTVFAEL